MKASEEYMAALAALRPRDVANYLTGSGWRPQEEIGRSTLWELSDDDERYEAVVPRDPGVRDYVVRMLQLLQILSSVENRPNSQILRDLTRADTDIQYVQTHPRTPPGTIPVSDAATALEGVRELMIAGAYGVVSPPSLVLPRRKARQVEDFPRLARVGPSLEGSYIISVEIPLDTEDALFPAGAPFGRRVLLRLYDTIRTARDAANEAMEISELSPFTDRVGEGISTTLCRALARFGGEQQDRPFEMRFSWAATLPTGVVTPPLRFDEHMVSVLAQAEEDLGGNPATERGVLVRGTVWRTERNRPTEPGWVVVRGIATIGGRQYRRLVWIRLEPDDFSVALQAADHGLPVEIDGVLVRTGRRTELQQPGRLRITEE
jgi:hypothetical protein